MPTITLSKWSNAEGRTFEIDTNEQVFANTCSLA